MESSVITPEAMAAGGTRGEAAARSEAIPWYLSAVLFASTSVLIGVMWDISWHQTIGRDSFLTPAHLAIYVGGAAAGLACGWLALKTTFAGTDGERARSVRFWGFRAPLGAWVAIWGSFAMITSAPFDDWWHNAYGLDVEILSPPHVVLALGIITIQIGALLMALSWQNRSKTGDGADGRSGADGTSGAASGSVDGSAHRGRALSLAYLYAGGLLVANLAVLLTEYTFANDMHSSLFYLVTAGTFPIVLLALGRAGRMRWPATTAALVYSAIVLGMMWILPLFGAEPLLAPVQRPLTHMVPPEFPLLLVFPAIAIDVLLRWFGESRGLRDWLLAGTASVVFVGILLVASWFFAEFMLSEGSRNFVFQGDTWPYTAAPGDWQYQFWNRDVDASGQATFGAFASSAVWALPIGFVSARIGLWWGNWMSRVRR